MKKALLITTVSGFVPQFELNQVHLLQEMGYEVHYASNFQNPHYGSDNRRLEGTGLICHQVDFVRSPFRIVKNMIAYQQLKMVLKENTFDLIHCHTPMGGVLGRLAAEQNRRKQKTEKKYKKYKGQQDLLKEQNREKKAGKPKYSKVFYTAHGFHFYRGAPWKNWLFYYPMERWLASYTDVLITINQEDYQIAKKFHLRKETSGKIEKINGVGLDISDYQTCLETVSLWKEKRKELGIPLDACVLISVGELTKRKNHQVVIKALASLKEDCKKKKVWYLICGEGPEKKKLQRKIRCYHLLPIVHFLGYRSDVKELLAASDCFLFPSKQEGLPVALMEAKAIGLPCICSNIRGNRELADAEELVQGTNSKDYREKIQSFLNQQIKKTEDRNGTEKKTETINRKQSEQRKENRIWLDAKKYSKEQVMQQMRKIYTENLENLEERKKSSKKERKEK